MSRSTTLLGCVGGALAVYGALIAWVIEMQLPVDVLPAILLAVVAMLASLAPQVVVHECGHAIAAISVGLRIKGVQMFGVRVAGTPGNSGHRSHVSLDLARPTFWVPARVAWTLVAGPAANLVTAVVAVLVAHAADQPWYVRVVAAGVAVGGVVLGVVNLAPSRPGARTNDGRKLLAWTLAPRRTSLAVAGSRRWVESVAGSTHPPRAVPTPAVGMAHTTPSALALARLVVDTAAADGAEAAVRAHYASLVQVLQRPAVQPSLVRVVAGATGLTLTTSLMRQQLTERRRADPRTVERIVVLLELGLDHVPHEMATRSALAMARILQGRDDEARRLLLDVDVDRVPNDDVALAYAVRAFAEAGCGDMDQARRLLQAAEQRAPGHAVVRLVRSVLDHVERARAVGGSTG